ncbi:UNVERIFIED_CONTAM: hypothetical protein Slati_3471400 [Sesamum latifolium]|uniref:Reverse transcriptase Ty1/copia-type domain-containing protein n=1 Tax=Sesamum latifolium TaxID=2727402 RepID=A0AAW2UGC7_9LAMI
MGEASYIIGIKIYRDRSKRMLTQSSYIEKVLKRFKMENLERGLLPMRHGIKLSKKQSPKTEEELKRMSDIPYASAVGSIHMLSSAPGPIERSSRGYPRLEAMKFEMDSMGSNQVWTLVDPPKDIRSVGCKWVYKRKLGADGEVTAFKVLSLQTQLNRNLGVLKRKLEPRLVAKGYTQQSVVDFEETYSPVVMAKSIQIMLAIATWYDYEI